MMIQKDLLRLPAEWEHHNLTQMAWPSANTDWAYMLDEVCDCFARMASEILKREPLLIVTDDRDWLAKWIEVDKHDNLFVVEMPINDTWARDHAFISLHGADGSQHHCDFQFNGWGMKFASCHDNQINKGVYDALLANRGGRYVSKLHVVLEGGSIESDGRGTILSTAQCLMAPNRNYFASEDEATEMLKRELCASRVLWLHHGYLAGDDTDSHVDTLARMAPNDSIVYVQATDESDEHTPELRLMEQELRLFRTADGRPYNLVPVPMTPAIFDRECGERLPATYANFYFVNGAILVPTYNVPTDEQALAVFRSAFPDYEVVGIDCCALIRQHGSLHCSTMQYCSNV